MVRQKNVRWQLVFEAEILKCALIKGFSKKDIHRILGMKYSTYRRKITTGSFTLAEFKRIIQVFGIPQEIVLLILEIKE